MKKLFGYIYHFFPIQIFLNYIKQNQVLLIFWIFLFAIINGVAGGKFGINALFLAPEYLYNIDYLSFLIFGFAFGIFVTSFHISSYIVIGYKFPVIVTFRKPFINFAYNNALIPVVFVINYFIVSYKFQTAFELINTWNVILNLFSFLVGFVLFMVLPFSYFFSTNRYLRRFLYSVDKNINKARIAKPIKKALDKDKKWKEKKIERDSKSRHRVRYYLSFPTKIKPTKDYMHYSSSLIQKILHQSHYNAALFSLVIIVLILLLGTFIKNEIFIIPSAASFLLFFTFFHILYGIFHSLFKEWSFFVLVIIILGANSIYQKNIFFQPNKATGLVYTSDSIENGNYFLEDEISDYNSEIACLNIWKEKTGQEKPKMIFVNTGGGGLKMTLWTYYALACIDSISNQKFVKNVRMFSGASGGTIGAAYFRELYRKRNTDTLLNLLDTTRVSRLSNDILNPILLSLVSRDWFLNSNLFPTNIKMDRAYEFEKYLNKNTENALNIPLSTYINDEKNADIPLLIISPTIINDGRRLLISASDISYMTTPERSGLFESSMPDNLEFRKIYKNFNADSLNILSALRMNATFPYISPVVTMPGLPEYKIMDASIIDNYGLSISLKYLNTFRSWIKENTSGVIFVQISEEEKTSFQENTLFGELVKPITAVFGNFFNMQIYNNAKIIDFSRYFVNNDIEFINITLPKGDNPIPLSWHLTKKEKERIINSIKSEKNINQIRKLNQEINYP
jgi:hypothetical protein